jgi:hypothetical protein
MTRRKLAPGRSVFRFVLLTLVTLSAPLAAQRTCKKGIPCGNSCISAGKVCHVGAGAPADAKPTALVAVPGVAVKGVGAQWVAFRDGSIYYRNVMGCEAARVPVKAERVYFRTAENAKSAGLTSSKEPGCQ